MRLGSMGLILGGQSFTGRGGYGGFMDFHNLGIHCWLEMFSLFVFIFFTWLLFSFLFFSFPLSSAPPCVNTMCRYNYIPMRR